jgi:tetratricopeptide (TPR) repeat protein
MFYRQYDNCIETLKRHLQMPTAVWDEERCASLRFIACSYQGKGEYGQARAFLYRAIAECPHVREPYLQMARLGYLLNDWPLMYLMTEEGLKITQKTGSYLSEPDAWGYAFYDYGAICCYRLRLFRKSFDYAAKACGIAPHDKRLKQNLELIKLKMG